MLASALTFDALLAMIPLGILLVAGVGFLLDQVAYHGPTDPGDLIGALLPVQVRLTGGPNELILTERILAAVRGYRSSLTLVAVPAFLWFSSRVFASMRVALTQVFEARQPQRHHQPVLDYLLTYLFAKLRDLRMIGIALVLAMANTILSGAVAVFNAEGVFLAAPWSFFATGLGRLLAEVVAFGSALLLFALLYRYASPKRLHWGGAFLAGGFATVGFEIAKRLFALYIASVGQNGVYSVDANIGAILLFILWIWYMALVFLIGAAAAKVWEEGRPGPVESEG